MVKYDQITKCYFQYYGVTMMRKYTIHNFVSSFSVKPNGSMSLLLGAGASISSGILSGGQMIWDFKREIYCNENKISKLEFPDLQKKTYRTKYKSILMQQEIILPYIRQMNIHIILNLCIPIAEIENSIYREKYKMLNQL